MSNSISLARCNWVAYQWYSIMWQIRDAMSSWQLYWLCHWCSKVACLFILIRTHAHVLRNKRKPGFGPISDRNKSSVRVAGQDTPHRPVSSFACEANRSMIVVCNVTAIVGMLYVYYDVLECQRDIEINWKVTKRDAGIIEEAAPILRHLRTRHAHSLLRHSITDHAWKSRTFY